MPNARVAHAVRLEFAPDTLVQSNLSGAAFTGDWLWVAGDEACGLDRLRRLVPVGREDLRFGETRGDQLRLAPLDDSGTLIRKHFLPLDGLGVRDLHFSGDDLFILAGPTMVLNGDIRVFKWPAARPVLAANREPVRFEEALTGSVSLPHGRGVNRAEAICQLPPTMSEGKARWLVLYDAPGADRKDGTRAVFGDLLHRD